MSAIKLEKLTKFYGKSRGIIDVDLEVQEGDFFGFIGPNGAGKSTTIRTLLGLITPTGGSATVFGKDVAKERLSVLEDTGYLPADAALYRGMRVRDVLALSAKLRKKDCRAEAKLLCERLELDSDRRVDELSLGNRKKVGIVCAMQHRPRLYVLDEPTSGLDPLIQREFYALLKERSLEGATVFLSSHVLSEIDRYCKHAAVIREGQILTSGSVAELAYTGIKRVTLRGVSDISLPKDAQNIVREGDTVHFLYNGDINLLLQQLSQIRVKDATVADPDLEDVFLHFYKKEGV